jgi:molecular chaperone GrpE
MTKEVNDMGAVSQEENVAEEVEVEVLEDISTEEMAETASEDGMIELSKFQRLQADFDNYKRRSRQEMSNMTCLGREQVIEELLNVVDNFSRALKVEPNQSGFPELKKGMELIYRQFEEVLTKHGLAPIDAEGNPFDPEFHQAIMQVDTESEDQDDVVVEDLQRGYTINGKVIRPSMVKVGKYCEKY